ncbi:MAG: FixH family protein [Euryhalocaulis sp.]|uniref:FixH family protein n=1 Tax=Euryhalocaulis sp. TaxID=2744307 RepID=UPI0017C4D03B|nr:FixH family protein [Euryhalocaulis sp.]MBA4800830.1 FixH family protein [Euryhalocaulis sp.]
MIREIKGWHVLTMIVGFFAVTIAVNATFITLAVGTFRGEEESKSYRQGLAYNAVLERRAAQTELGWSAELESREGAVTLHIVDAQGAPVSGLNLAGAVKHPADAAHDHVLAFAYAGEGLYVAHLADTLAEGSWIVEVSAAPEPFELKSRIWVR